MLKRTRDIFDDAESTSSGSCTDEDNIEMQNYKTGYFDNLVESPLKPYEDEEEINIKDLHNMVIKRASKSYANIKLMENDKFGKSLLIRQIIL